MRGQQSKSEFKKLEVWTRQCDDPHRLPAHLDAHAVVKACPGFTFEKTALEALVAARGHILLASVICHPETAGGGLEYAWEKLKYEQRHKNEDEAKLVGGLVFIKKIKDLCSVHTIIPMSRVWKFQRRARDYIRLYISTSTREGETALKYEEIVKMRKECKTHRNVMELDRVFY
jgi:hypothetical protein